jgi:hypothetical protein
VDPLTCPKYQGWIKIISFTENEEVINKIFGWRISFNSNDDHYLNGERNELESSTG